MSEILREREGGGGARRKDKHLNLSSWLGSKPSSEAAPSIRPQRARREANYSRIAINKARNSGIVLPSPLPPVAVPFLRDWRVFLSRMRLQLGEVMHLLLDRGSLFYSACLYVHSILRKRKEESWLVSGRDTGRGRLALLLCPCRGETRARFVRVAGDRNTRA